MVGKHHGRCEQTDVFFIKDKRKIAYYSMTIPEYLQRNSNRDLIQTFHASHQIEQLVNQTPFIIGKYSVPFTLFLNHSP